MLLSSSVQLLTAYQKQQVCKAINYLLLKFFFYALNHSVSSAKYKGALAIPDLPGKRL